LDAVKAHMLNRRTSTFREHNPLEQYSLVLDFAGAGMNNVDWEAFHVTLEEASRHYPNMGSQVYMLSVNLLVRWVWAAARRFMHPKIQRKCQLVRPEDVPACMQKLLPLENIPVEYGGTGAPWPGPSDAQTLEDQVGELAAAVYLRAGVVPNGARPPRQGRQMNTQSASKEAAKLRHDAARLRRSDSESAKPIWACCVGGRQRKYSD